MLGKSSSVRLTDREWASLMCALSVLRKLLSSTLSFTGQATGDVLRTDITTNEPEQQQNHRFGTTWIACDFGATVYLRTGKLTVSGQITSWPNADGNIYGWCAFDGNGRWIFEGKHDHEAVRKSGRYAFPAGPYPDFAKNVPVITPDEDHVQSPVTAQE